MNRRKNTAYCFPRPYSAAAINAVRGTARITPMEPDTAAISSTEK